MNQGYTSERNAQILIALLKAHGIRKVIASPGSTNICFVASLQHDPWFEMYSAVDERSAAYMACGLAAESGEPVVINCTGATASRNYMPGLTEAYYSKLPVLAVTCSQSNARIGQNYHQITDRTDPPSDVAKKSVQLPMLFNAEDERNYAVLVNDAILELTHGVCGPVHINLETRYSGDYSTTRLPDVQVIDRVGVEDDLPDLVPGRIGVYVGSHRAWDGALVESLERFCAATGAVVVTDQSSNYRGPYAVLPALLTHQALHRSELLAFDTMVYVGDVCGAEYKTLRWGEMWKVCQDGRVQDAFGGLRYVFEMSERRFFDVYADRFQGRADSGFLDAWKAELAQVESAIPELPFSNIWCARQAAPLMPEGSELHLGIMNSLRAWNFFSLPPSVTAHCNTGGFGIDGGVSTLVGSSLANPGRLYFGVVGDLAFFYDMNALGNRHVGPNVRLMVVNNGLGQQFKNPGNPGHPLGSEADPFIAAAGHFGCKSPDLLRHYAEDLGFDYRSARSKGEFVEALPEFVDPGMHERPMVFEVFVDTDDESEALRTITHIREDPKLVVRDTAKRFAKAALGGRTSILTKIAGK